MVAHPDDEILWLAPAVANAATIIAALPGHADDPAVTRGRELVRAQYPVGAFEFLPLRSAGVHQRSDWRRRRPMQHGVDLKSDCPPERTSLYRENYQSLLELLSPYLGQHHIVFTHNPWGEYGHEEHVQVSNVVMSLASRHGCSVWAWDGFQERRLLSEDMRLRTDYFGAQTSSLPTQQLRVDSSLFGSVRDLYLANGAWTWDSTYEPPPSSTYIQLVREGEVLIRPADAPRRGRSLRIAGRSALRAARRGGRLARRAASTMARGD